MGEMEQFRLGPASEEGEGNHYQCVQKWWGRSYLELLLMCWDHPSAYPSPRQAPPLDPFALMQLPTRAKAAIAGGERECTLKREQNQPGADP